MVQGAGSSWTSALAADSEKPSDSSHEWRRPNVMASVASSKFCVKSSFDDTLETVHDLPERVVRCGIWLSPRCPKLRCWSGLGSRT